MLPLIVTQSTSYLLQCVLQSFLLETHYLIKEKLNCIGVLHFFPLTEENNNVASFNTDPLISSLGTIGPISHDLPPRMTNNVPLCDRLQQKMLEELPQLYGAIVLLWDSHGANSNDADVEKSSIYKVAIEYSCCDTY